eukprot:1148733-Rhodomonas_salina.1
MRGLWPRGPSPKGMAGSYGLSQLKQSLYPAKTKAEEPTDANNTNAPGRAGLSKLAEALPRPRQHSQGPAKA